MCSSRKNSYPPQGRSLEIPKGRGVLKAKILEAKYEDKLGFPVGRVGGAKQKKKTFCGRSMDIFWTCTISFSVRITSILVKPYIHSLTVSLH